MIDWILVEHSLEFLPWIEGDEIIITPSETEIRISINRKASAVYTGLLTPAKQEPKVPKMIVPALRDLQN